MYLFFAVDKIIEFFPNYLLMCLKMLIIIIHISFNPQILVITYQIIISQQFVERHPTYFTFLLNFFLHKWM